MLRKVTCQKIRLRQLNEAFGTKGKVRLQEMEEWNNNIDHVEIDSIFIVL